MRKFLPLSFLAAAAIGGVAWYFNTQHPTQQPAPAEAPKKEVATQTVSKPVTPVTPDNPPVVSTVKKAKPDLEPDGSEPSDPFALNKVVSGALDEFKEALKAKGNEALLALIEKTQQSLVGMDRGRFITEASKLLAETDPARAAALLKQMKDPRDQQLFGNMVATALCAKDPQLAAQWAGTLDPGLPARALYSTIGREWAAKDIRAVTGWINGLNNENQTILQSAAIEGIMFQQADKDFAKSVEYAKNISDEYLRNAALVQAAKVLAVKDPAASAQFAMTLPVGMPQRQATVYAITQWTAQDAPAAAGFAQQINDPIVKGEALLATAKTWKQLDETAATTWIKTLPAETQQQINNKANVQNLPK